MDVEWEQAGRAQGKYSLMLGKWVGSVHTNLQQTLIFVVQ